MLSIFHYLSLLITMIFLLMFVLLRLHTVGMPEQSCSALWRPVKAFLGRVEFFSFFFFQ